MEKSKPKTILIVEDDEAVRQSIAEVVQFCGWQVLEASNGLLGLALFKIHLPDIVLTDVVMDGLDGFELTARIKSLNTRAAVIIMTAFSTPHLRKQVQSVGASDFLCKPFEPEELLLALTRSLEDFSSDQKS